MASKRNLAGDAIRLKRYGYSSQWPGTSLASSKTLMAKTKTAKRKR